MTKKLAFSAVLTALSTVCLCGSVLLPTGKIALLAISSFCVLLTTAECGTRFGMLTYISTTLIGFLFLSFKLQIALFAGLLGYYPVIKSYMERIGNRKLEWLVKILFFNAVLVIAYFVMRYVFMPRMDFGVMLDYAFAHLPVLVIAAEILFILYDYMLTILATYYIQVIQKRMKHT